MATRKSKRLQNLNAKKRLKTSDYSDDEPFHANKTITNEEAKRIKKLLKESFVLLEHAEENQFIQLSINNHGKSYLMIKGKIGNKGRKTNKKFKSKKTTFDTAKLLLISKMNEGFIIVEEFEKDEQEEKKCAGIQKLKTIKVDNNTLAPVDEYFVGDPSTCVFEEDGVVYDAMLNQTNIHQNNNKFYKIQILQNGNGETFSWFRWGRVGYKGQTSLTSGTSQELIGKFTSKFYSKTLNEWENRDNFQSFARKYTYLPMDYSNAKENDPWDNNNNTNITQQESEIESKLHPAIQDLIQLIFDKKMMKDHMREIGYDANKLPLGKINDKVITNAYQVLKDIEYELGQKDDVCHEVVSSDDNNTNTNLRRSKRKRNRNSNKSSRKVNRYAITQLSSTYYTLIPHEFGYRMPPPINSEILLKKEMKLIEALSEIEVVSRLLSKENKKEIIQNPIDKHFDLLKTEMENVEKNENEFKMLTKYVQNTHAATHNRYSLNVEAIFRINKYSENETFKKWEYCENRMLLWHGSRLTNYAGIISNGLRIAPPQAPVTGYMFGKGVYFADMCSKSANYCFTTKDKDVGLLLLCEVALGEMNELFYSDYNAKDILNGKHCTKGVGKTAPDLSQYVRLENGCIVPLGKAKKDNTIQSSLLYNEFIVYDTSQIKMRYLVKLKFDYNETGNEW